MQEATLQGFLFQALLFRIFQCPVFFVPAAISAVFCVLIFAVTNDVTPPKTYERQRLSVSTLFAPLRKRDVRRMMVPAMLHGIIKDNVSLWMVVYIAERFSLHLDSTAWYVLLIPAAGLLGRLIYPLIYRCTGQNEYFTSGIGAAIGIAAALLLTAGPSSPLACVLCLSALYASVSIINSTILAIFPMQFSAEDAVSSVSGFMDFSTYLGAGIGSFVFAKIIGFAGYTAMFAVWGLASLVCALYFFCYRKFGLIE